MEAEDCARAPAVLPAERRAQPRLSIQEDAVLRFLETGLSMPCRILDISLEGCRLRAGVRLPSRPNSRIEVTFKINGMAFRLSGAMQWTDGRHTAGIRFLHMPARRKIDLAEVLDEIHAAEQAKSAVNTATAPAPEKSSAEASSPLPAEPPASASDRSRERRAHSRHPVDTSATILLVKIGSRLRGKILNVSLGGCRIQTSQPFPVGIYTRVETEFFHHGLPFRLAGVVQTIHNAHQIGIRFVELSERKRRYLLELIEGIEAMSKTPEPAR